MKYYEILYNSSQSMRSGGVGFGVRAQSEGLPQEYLEVASPGSPYQKGKFKAPFASELITDTSKILSYPVLFSYEQVETPSGRRLYLLRRNVALEFDYAYYETGKATRPGNYAEHTLIFDERPDASIFQILYEQPAEGSLAFRPVNRIPSPENEELRGYMLGRSEDFKVEDRLVATRYNAPIREEAFNILFHLVEARKLNRKLVVLLAEEGKSIIMGDLCRLARRFAVDISFSCAYTQNFDPKRFEITYITEHNTAPEITETGGYIVRKATERSKSEAYEKYCEMLKQAALTGDEATLEKVVSWLLSGDYTFVEGTSAEVSLGFFNYCTSPELFGVEQLNHLDLMEVVARREQGSKEHALIHTRIEELVRAALSTQEIPQLASALLLVDQLKRAGIEIEPARALLGEECSLWMSALPERLATLYKALPLEIFDLWIRREHLYTKRSYLLEDVMQDKLKSLYRYFYVRVDEALGDLLAQLLYKLEPQRLAELLQDANPDAMQRQRCYMGAIAQNVDHVKRLWEVAVADLGDGMRVDLFEYFAPHFADERFAELFYYGFRNRQQQPLQLIQTAARLVACNAAFKELLLEGERRMSIYRLLFAEVAPMVRRSEASELLMRIDRDMIKPLNSPTASFLYEWIYLYHLLAGTWMQLPKTEPDALYEVALKVGDSSYLREVTKQRLVETSEAQSIQLRTLLHELENRALLDETLLAELLPGFATEKQHRLLELFFELRKTPFKEALALTEQYNYVVDVERVLETLYEKEYKSLCRNRKIKGFFSGLFGGKRE